jgi:hypothetical protein
MHQVGNPQCCVLLGLRGSLSPNIAHQVVVLMDARDALREPCAPSFDVWERSTPAHYNQHACRVRAASASHVASTTLVAALVAGVLFWLLGCLFFPLRLMMGSKNWLVLEGKWSDHQFWARRAERSVRPSPVLYICTTFMMLVSAEARDVACLIMECWWMDSLQDRF